MPSVASSLLMSADVTRARAMLYSGLRTDDGAINTDKLLYINKPQDTSTDNLRRRRQDEEKMSI